MSTLYNNSPTGLGQGSYYSGIFFLMWPASYLTCMRWPVTLPIFGHMLHNAEVTLKLQLLLGLIQFLFMTIQLSVIIMLFDDEFHKLIRGSEEICSCFLF